MSFSGWIVSIFIFIIIMTIAIGIGWWIRNNSKPNPVPPNKYSAPLGWGKVTAGPDPAKNICQLYTFPTAIVNIGDPPIPTVFPGTPTFNSKILDSLSGITGYIECLDSDQIMAQQVQHTCIAPVGVVNGQITKCDLINGGTTGLGGIEVFYTNSNCSKIPLCAGELSLLSLNFGAPTTPIKCIKNNGQGNIVTMEDCDPSDSNQLFRITRINPGQNPSSLKPNQGQNGFFAQILDRNTGLCLQPSNMNENSIFDPKTTPNPDCTAGSGTSFSGLTLTFDSCTGTTGTTGTTGLGSGFPGYNWAFIESVQYCDNPDGCTNISITPPQIIYANDLNFSTFPTNGYKGLTGASANILWLLDNDAKALYYGGKEFPILRNKIGTDVNVVCSDFGYTAQYMNLNIYNIISEESVCFATDKPLTDCIGL